ncbi:MAG: enoyl-CoA hydratase-related protein [Nitrospinota bacterium]
MEYEDILFEVRDGAAWVTINRPEKLNAFRQKTLYELIDAFERVDADPAVGVAVLRGAGERAFSSGGEIQAMRDLEFATGHVWNNLMIRIAHTIRNCGKPAIAAVRGWCMGGGNELQLFCDLCMATEDAIFGQTGARVGACPVMGATQYLPHLIGQRKAREMIFLCERYTAREALEMGLINKVVPNDKLEEEVEKWCRRILSLCPLTLRYTKTSLNFEGDQLYASWLHGSELLNVIWNSEQCKEGMNAFLEKREPDFSRFLR